MRSAALEQGSVLEDGGDTQNLSGAALRKNIADGSTKKSSMRLPGYADNGELSRSITAVGNPWAFV